MHLSRRGLLKGMGAGLMAGGFGRGVALGRPAPGLNTDDEPSLLWKVALPDGYKLESAPAYFGGSIIMNARNGTDYRSFLFWLDIQTSRYSNGPLALGGEDYAYFGGNPALLNGVLYVPFKDGGLFALDPNTLQTLWSNQQYRLAYTRSMSASTVALAQDGVVFLTTDGQFVRLNEEGNAIWHYSTGNSAKFASLAINADGTIFGCFNEKVYAVNGSGDLLWKFSNPAGEAINGLAAGSGNVYFTAGSALYAVDASTGKLSWKAVSSAITAPPVYNGGTIYVAADAGNFLAYKANDGTKQWDVNLGTKTAFDVFVEDDVAYVGSWGRKIYAIDLLEKGKQVVSYAADAIVLLIGSENGVCYFTDLQLNAVYAVDLGHQVHQYSCESQLMADNYVASNSTGSGYQPSSPWYETQIQLQDSAAVPRVNKSVKITVSDSAAIVTGGKTYQVGPQVPLWLTTDGGGQLSLAVQATDLSCPSLSLWGNFMEPKEAIVIYPDHDSSSALSQLQGSDLMAAKTFDGTAMLPHGYSGADALAFSIQQTMGAVPASLLMSQFPNRRNLTAAQTKYLSYPDTSQNIVYQRVAGSTSRPYIPGNTPAWSLQIDAAGEASYVAGPAGSLLLPTGIAGDFKAFARNVVHGTEKVVSVGWQAVKDGAKTVIHTLDNAYEFAVTAVEHAIAVAAGVLKTVIGDIKKPIEWLSYVMNWDDVKKTKQQIVDLFNDWLTSMQTQSASALQQIQSTVDHALDTAVTDIDEAIAFTLKKLGTSSIQSNQVAGNDPLAIVGTGVKHWYSSLHWLLSKVTNKLPTGLGQANVPASYASFLQTFDNLVQTVQQQISQDPALRDIANISSDFLTQMGSLFSNPAQAIRGAAADVVKLFGDIARLFLRAVKVAADTVLATLPSLFGAMRDLLNQEIQIPGITELWKLVSGDPLTSLDLGALLVALPASIIQKATGVQSSGTYPGQVPTLLGDSWPYFVATIVNMSITAFQDFLGVLYSVTLQSLQVALTGLQTAFVAPPSLQDALAHPEYYISFVGRVGIWIAQAYMAIKDQITGIPGLSEIGISLSFVGGTLLCTTALSEFLHETAVPEDFRIKEFIASLCEGLPLTFKPLKWDAAGSLRCLTLSGIDIAGGWTAAGLRVSLWA